MIEMGDAQSHSLSSVLGGEPKLDPPETFSVFDEFGKKVLKH